MKKRILVIDDEVDLAYMLKFALEREGYYHVRLVDDPSKAVEAAAAFGPDLILLDVMMPGTAGTEVAARLRADPCLCDTPIVFLTALATGEDRIAGDAVTGLGAIRPSLQKLTPLPGLIECIELHTSHRELRGEPAAGVAERPGPGRK